MPTNITTEIHSDPLAEDYGAPLLLVEVTTLEDRVMVVLRQGVHLPNDPEELATNLEKMAELLRAGLEDERWSRNEQRLVGRELTREEVVPQPASHALSELGETHTEAGLKEAFDKMAKNMAAGAPGAGGEEESAEVCRPPRAPINQHQNRNYE